MTQSADARFMKLALGLGARGQGRVWPWPSVGCVIVRDGRIVGRGVSDPDSIRHGEVVALDRAGDLALGATAYVTLEPCAHHGRTPPCADALIAAGVSRVVAATEDPDPKVNGKGLEMLRKAGIEVQQGVMKPEADASHSGFFSRVRTGRPMVTLKLAATLDGRIATASGESKWITGPLARRSVHALRARHDAVMIGGTTARTDDPELTARGIGVDRQPVRVIWSQGLDLPLTGKLGVTAGEVPVWILHGEQADRALVSAWTDLGAQCLLVGLGSDKRLDPVAALQALGTAGLTRVLCEGGGALAASLLQAGLVDQIYHYSAGKALGADGHPMIGALDISKLADAPEFALVETRALGGDVLTIRGAASTV